MISNDKRDTSESSMSARLGRLDAWGTQELDADDVIEVQAIADRLVDHTNVAPKKTDDCAGQAPSTSTLRAMHEDDAYFHPGGTIRSLADATLEGWRPEPTIVFRRVRARSRRSWLLLGLVALVGPLLLVALVNAGLSQPAPARDRSAGLHVLAEQKTSLDGRVMGRASRSAAPIRDVRSLPTARSRSR